VPLSVVYSGSKRAGAAGTGREVPMWYVQRSNTALRRKPEVTTDGSLSAAERLYVSLGGGPQLMVKHGNVHVPFMGGEYGELSQEGNGWRYRTLDGTAYLFEPWNEISGAPSNTPPADLWLLTRISAGSKAAPSACIPTKRRSSDRETGSMIPRGKRAIARLAQRSSARLAT
jgi:hypothetical protein